MTRTYLTTLVPIEAGRQEALRKTLADLPTGSASPFQRVAGTHMTRLCVLDHYGGALFGPLCHRSLDPALLVVTAIVDGPGPAWAESLPATIGPTVEAVWTHCSGFPGIDNGGAFARWLLDHEVAASFAVIANHDTVDAVRKGLDLRARLGQFAARLEGGAPAAVRAAYRQGFDR
jgi:hypothetical protein